MIKYSFEQKKALVTAYLNGETSCYKKVWLFKSFIIQK